MVLQPSSAHEIEVFPPTSGLISGGRTFCGGEMMWRAFAPVGFSGGRDVDAPPVSS